MWSISRLVPGIINSARSQDSTVKAQLWFRYTQQFAYRNDYMSEYGSFHMMEGLDNST